MTPSGDVLYSLVVAFAELAPYLLGAAMFAFFGLRLGARPFVVLALTVVLGAVGALAYVSVALGAEPCPRARLAGMWDVYLVDVTSDTPAGLEVFTICLDARGRVTPRAGCDAAVRGQLVLYPSCQVDGSLTLSGHPLLTRRVRATLVPDGDVMQGVATAYFGDPMTFAAVRR